MNKEIVGFLAKTLNREHDAVASLFNDDGSLKENALTQFETWDADRVTKLKGNTDGTFDQGYKKGEAKASSKFEKLLKSTFDFDSEATGEELVSELASAVNSKKPQVAQLTEDDVKKHPVFLKAEKAHKAALEEAQKKATEDIEKFKGEQLRKERFSSVEKLALNHILSKNPILPEDKAKADIRLQRDVIQPLKDAGYDYEINDGEVIVIKDGKRVENKHGNPVQFTSLIEDIAALSLDFKQHQERRSPNGPNPPPPQNGKPNTQFVPKDEKEYQEYIQRKDVPAEERAAVVQAWNAPKN